MTEQASLAIFFFEIRGQDALKKLFNDTIVADQKALDYNRAQFDTGITDQISVVEAENTLQNAQATATNLGVARAQFEHAIAVLIGRVASNFSIPVKVLKAAPPPIPIGVPSQLLERRPDVAAAERTMAAANAQIGIAYAAYYPTRHFGRPKWICEFGIQQFIQCLQSHLVHRTFGLRNDFRRGTARRHGPPIRRDL